MSRITVSEKEHWKERISTRIKKAIQAIEVDNPTEIEDIKNRSEMDAHTYLGIKEEMKRIAEIEKSKAAMDREADILRLTCYRIVLNEPDLKESAVYWSHKDRFQKKVESVRERFEEKLFEQAPFGKKIIALRAEAETLLDTVWLATSSTQIRELWTRVIAAIDGELSPIQKQLLEKPAALENK